MNRQRLLQLVLLLALFSFLPSARAQPASDAAQGIEGVISVSPIHGGPARIGVPDSRPLANIDFVVENGNGAVASFKTDDQGRFRISLPPGHYTVSLKDGKRKIGRYGPFDVDVATGQFTKVQWTCDSGMR